MKKILSIIIAAIFLSAFSCFAYAADEVASVELTENIRNGYTYAAISGLDKDGNAVWVKETSELPEKDSQPRFISYGIKGNHFCYLDFDVLTILDSQTGDFLWSFNGATSIIFISDYTLLVADSDTRAVSGFFRAQIAGCKQKDFFFARRT